MMKKPKYNFKINFKFLLKLNLKLKYKCLAIINHILQNCIIYLSSNINLKSLNEEEEIAK